VKEHEGNKTRRVKDKKLQTAEERAGIQIGGVRGGETGGKKRQMAPFPGLKLFQLLDMRVAYWDD